jgi:O-antigen ligase
MATYIAGIGAMEVILQRDLMALPDAQVFYAGDRSDEVEILVRPNGPFGTISSFALIGVVCFFFLLFLKKAKGELPAWERFLHRVGVGAALMVTLMPLLRSVVGSLAVILLVDAWFQTGWRRLSRGVLIASFGVVFLLMRLLLPAVFEERSSGENLYGRFAQQVQTFRMFADHPMGGVGLNNFHDAALASGRYEAYFGDTESVDYPHNNLGAVLAETGLSGFVPFLSAQILLFLAFSRSLRARKDGADAWKYCLFLFLAYWINGMSLQSCYFSDLNLIFVFVLMVLYKYSVTQPGAAAIA